MEFQNEQDFYLLLGVERDCDFATLKRAYYQSAKRCHPDRFGNSAAKTEEFKRLVHAFATLSDPAKRMHYDRMRGFAEAILEKPRKSLLDTEADDILEELIVGNNAPPESSLATLMRDLTKTEIFVTWREGCDHLAHRRFLAAERALGYVVGRAPGNILFRVMLARAHARRRRYSLAFYHYQIAIGIGKLRVPPQSMNSVRQEYEALRANRNPLARLWNRLFGAKPFEFSEDAAERMVRELNAGIAREWNTSARKRLK